MRSVALRSGSRGFSLVAPTGAFVLGPHGTPSASIQANVVFNATITGSYSDTLEVHDTCGVRNMVVLRATVGSPSIAVSDIDFSTTLVGSSKTRSFSIQNVGDQGSTLTVLGADGPADVVFTLPDGMPAFPLQIAAGQVRQVRVAFGPTAAKAYTDQIVIHSDAQAAAANDSVCLLNGVGGQVGAARTESRTDDPSVTPNPARGGNVEIAFTATGGEPVTIGIVDAAGRVVLRHRVREPVPDPQSVLLDVQGLPSGRYTCEVSIRQKRSRIPLVTVRQAGVEAASSAIVSIMRSGTRWGASP